MGKKFSSIYGTLWSSVGDHLAPSITEVKQHFIAQNPHPISDPAGWVSLVMNGPWYHEHYFAGPL